MINVKQKNKAEIVESRKLYTIVTVILGFIITHVFTFIEIFSSSYSFKLLSSVLSFYLVEFP